MLDDRLSRLRPAKTNLKTRRPYPPVFPKFANPDEPSQVWSGRGKRPHWVTEKLASGLALEDLSMGRGPCPNEAEEPGRTPGSSVASASISVCSLSRRPRTRRSARSVSPYHPFIGQTQLATCSTVSAGAYTR